jgi:hypothetical protein
MKAIGYGIQSLSVETAAGRAAGLSGGVLVRRHHDQGVAAVRRSAPDP